MLEAFPARLADEERFAAGPEMEAMDVGKPLRQARADAVALGRYLAYIISSLPFFIGFMVIGWNEEKKGFHDMICKTRVIYGKL